MKNKSENKAHKTNAMRMLESAHVDYDVKTYEVDEDDLGGMHVAAQMAEPPEQIFKTLVLLGERTGHLVCCIPVNQSLDMKKVARAAGDKKVEMVHMKELFALTGYVRGGCSPLGMKKQFPTYIDETAVLFDRIAVSAGERGEQILVNGEELAGAVGAKLVDLCIE